MAFSKAGVDISYVNAVKQPAATLRMSLATSSDMSGMSEFRVNITVGAIISIKSHEAAGKSRKYTPSRGSDRSVDSIVF